MVGPGRRNSKIHPDPDSVPEERGQAGHADSTVLLGGWVGMNHLRDRLCPDLAPCARDFTVSN